MPYSTQASVAKLVATDAAMKVTTDAVQVFGGVGYTRDFRVERYMREAKITQIFEGTNQIQRLRHRPGAVTSRTRRRFDTVPGATLPSPGLPVTVSAGRHLEENIVRTAARRISRSPGCAQLRWSEP